MRRAEPDEETIFCFEFFNWYIYTYLGLRWGGVYDEERQTKVTYWRSIHDMSFLLKSNLPFHGIIPRRFFDSLKKIETHFPCVYRINSISRVCIVLLFDAITRLCNVIVILSFVQILVQTVYLSYISTDLLNININRLL